MFPDLLTTVTYLEIFCQEDEVIFEVGLEIREDDGKGNMVYVPRFTF